MAQFTNQATISYTGGEASSNIVTGEITQAIVMTKDSAQECYRQGDTLTYVISLRNTGAAAFSGLTLTDNLGRYAFGEGGLVPLEYAGLVLYYVNGVLQPTPTVTPGPPLSISGISIPAGGNAAIVYRVRAGETAPLGEEATITNTVALTGEGLITPVTAEASVDACTGARLAITKALSPTSVTENGTLAYTFTITNTGSTPADAAAGIVFSDTFDPILKNISVTLNGTVLSEAGNYTYNAATGLFTTTAGVITVPAATYAQNPTTGVWSITPGTTVLKISGTV